MAKYSIGIDLGGTNIKFGMLDDSLRPGKTTQIATPKSPDALVQAMIDGALQYMRDNNLKTGDVAGVGIGAPGPLDLEKGIVIDSPNIPGMQNMPLRDRIAAGVGVPTVLENDANAAGFGEYLCGAGGAKGDMVLLTLGTGVGSGIIIDGRLVHGWHGIGAEIGHMIVQPGGEQCGCGQCGCLERYCSATYIGLRAQRLVEQGRPSSLAGVLHSRSHISSKDIVAAARAGDALAAEVWDESVRYLAIACVSIARVLDPDRVVLAGGMVNAGHDLMTPLIRHYEQLHWRLTPVKTQIVIAKLGNDAGAIGAAGVAWKKFVADNRSA
jgi:glucokinase